MTPAPNLPQICFKCFTVQGSLKMTEVQNVFGYAKQRLFKTESVIVSV